MQYLVQCTRTRVAPKNLSVMVCTCLHWISLPYMEVVQLIVQKKWNGRKRSETVGNGRKHDQAKTCSTRIFLKISISAQRRFFWRSKVSKGKRLETVGDCTFARQKKHVFTQFSKMFHEHMLQNNNFFAERRCDLRLFPTVSPWTPLDLQKKGVARKCLF